MDIQLAKITVRELTQDYKDNNEGGVTGLGGKLDIRPLYQREFVYAPAQRDEVIRTVSKGFPLNIMYWARTGDDTFEIIDGQQRTISLCQYIASVFSVEFEEDKPQYFHSLPADIKEKMLDYELTVYKCQGTDSEKLDWFKTINIAGKPLTDQELRNAVYTGTWVTDAKRYFSKTNCAASNMYGDYLTGTAIRQEYLETAISWVADRDGVSIEEYMSKHQHDEDASELWQYFQEVFGWVTRTFSNVAKERQRLMRGQPWGVYYNEYKGNQYNAKQLEEKIIELISDEEVEANKGIYLYLLSNNKKHLNLRTFSEKDKQKMFQTQGGVCPRCTKTFEFSQMDADHVEPWSAGGTTTLSNGQMLCRRCNNEKSDK